MTTEKAYTGLPEIGDVPWGSHFCQFYNTAEDLTDALVPFFRAGLGNNEQCIWVTSGPLQADAAHAALQSAMPDLDQRLRSRQIEIFDYDEWYTKGGGKQDIDAVLNDWIARKERALALGYTGLRVSGNTCWIETRDQWRTFADYEAKVNACFCDHRIIAMCSYHLGRCTGADTMDVIRNHQFAIVRENGAWNVIESASVKAAKDELRRVNASLERRVAERTAQLRESDQQLRELLEALPAAVYTTDAAGRITYYNQASVDLAGRRPALGTDEWCVTWKLYWPDGSPMPHDQCPMAIALKENRPVRGGEAVAERPDGRRIPFIPYPTPLRDSSGALVGAVNMLVDITERKRAEAALHASEARFRGLFENAGVGMLLMDAKGTITAVNAAFCDIVARSEVELIGASCASFTHPDDVAETQNLLAKLASGDPGTVTIEKRYLARDGWSIWVRINVAKLGDGRELVAIVEDVTERVVTSERLRESDARLQLLADNISQFAWMAEPDGSIFWYNKRWHEYTGTTLEQMQGGDWRPLLHPDHAAQVIEELRRNWDSGQPWEGTYLLRSAKGEWRWFLTRAEPFRNRAGEILRWLGTNTDVTEQRAIEQALRDLTATLEKRVEAVVAEREAAQMQLAHVQRMEALGQLAGGIAHDFNNVLQAVQGGSALIERRPGDAEGVRRLARMVIEASERGAAVTRRLLAFSRRGDLRAEPVDATELLADMREILAHTLGAGIEVRLKAAPGLMPLMADKGQLETVLINLATNARDAMPGGGILTLGAANYVVERSGASGHPLGMPAGSYVRLLVSDTGAGMDATTLLRVTEPFFTTKPQGKGTGLGLAMARGFAEQSGGGLQIESEPDRGTTVTLWLPVAASDSVIAAPEAEAGLAPQRAHARLLLVDDDRIVLETLAQQLEAAGYAVLTAASADAALALLDAGEAMDLVVSDLSMPGMGGVNLIREVHRRRRGLPAILLTGFSSAAAEIAVGGAVSGAFSLLRKPISGDQLAERAMVMLQGVSTPG